MSGRRTLGRPRLHLRRTGSTNDEARARALAGAPDGMLVTAGEQRAGRGRQGRTWSAPAGQALLCSLVIRDPPELLPLMAGAAVAELVGPDARLKWPNDVLLQSRKVGGILVEGRPQEGWAVLGIGLNAAVRIEHLPAELRDRAGTLGLDPDALEPLLERLLDRLGDWLSAEAPAVLDAFRARDALLGRPVRWTSGHGQAGGIDARGRLIVVTTAGPVSLDSGEVHLLGADG